MIHAIAYVAFILLFTAWLGFELKRKYNLKTHWLWVAAAFAAGIIGSLIYSSLSYSKFGNFLLHASGGISATFLFVYTCKTLNLKFVNWRVTLLVLFAFVSMLGVLNELAEYFFELLGFGQFAFDIHDTWRDFVANTTGMIVAWTIICTFRKRLL